MGFRGFADDCINLFKRHPGFFGVVEKLGESGLIKGFATIDKEGDFRGVWVNSIFVGILGYYSILPSVFLFGFGGFGKKIGNRVVWWCICESQNITIFNNGRQFDSEKVFGFFFQNWIY